MNGNDEITSIKANQLRLGYLVYKGSKLTSVSINDLNEILKEENLDLAKRQYKPIPLSEKWLTIIGFEKKVNPITKDILFTDKSGLQVRQSKKGGGFSLGYTLKERNGDFQYSPNLIFLHEVFDAFILLKKIVFTPSDEQIDEIEQLLKK